MTPLGESALELAGMGFKIFPCRERAKEPLIVNPFQRATNDPNIVRGWWADRNYNPALPTGVTNGIWIADIDSGDDEAWLREMEARHGPLPATRQVITGRGRHIYFASPPSGPPIRNIQNRDDLVDVRGEGGFVLAAGSVHPTGHVYRWDGPEQFAEAPAWLIQIVTRRDAGELPLIPTDWNSFIGEIFTGSSRGSACAKLAGLLLRRFVEPTVALDLVRIFNKDRCDPPLDDSEIRSIFVNIGRRERARRESKV
jgi:hypothetical protein